jgi:hypothetical protein
MSEPFGSAVFAMHSLEWWWVLLVILLLLVFAALPVFFVSLPARAVRRGTRPQESLTTLRLQPNSDQPHDRQNPFDGA